MKRGNMRGKNARDYNRNIQKWDGRKKKKKKK